MADDCSGGIAGSGRWELKKRNEIYRLPLICVIRQPGTNK
jgi:hypothetical protein